MDSQTAVRLLHGSESYNLSPRCSPSSRPECTCRCVEAELKRGVLEVVVLSTNIQSTQPHMQIFHNSVLPSSSLVAQRPACTCLLRTAVTTPSAPNSTINLHPVTGFKVDSAVRQGSDMICSDRSVGDIR